VNRKQKRHNKNFNKHTRHFLVKVHILEMGTCLFIFKFSLMLFCRVFLNLEYESKSCEKLVKSIESHPSQAVQVVLNHSGKDL